MEHGDGGDEEHVDDGDHLADDQMWEVSRAHLVMSPFKASPPPQSTFEMCPQTPFMTIILMIIFTTRIVIFTVDIIL